jgi:Dolichyl-phosphate-mannose-protein mannosyltransferase
VKSVGQQVWIGFGIAVIVAIAIAASFWIMDHPFGTTWDEARYLNRAHRDVAFFRDGGVGNLLKVLVSEDRTRPPAYRLLVLPVTLLFGANAVLLRFLALAWLGVSLGLTFLIARRIAGPAAGAFAVAFLYLCPIVVGPGMRFYVDYPYYVAIAALLYFLLGDWERSSWNWLGLGLALGLGMLAKPPFLLVVVPLVGLAILLRRSHIWAGPDLRTLAKSVAVGILVMLPWWAFNAKPALAKAFRSSGYVRHSLGPKGSFGALSEWLHVFIQTMLGPALAALALALVVTVVVQFSRKVLRVDRAQWVAIAFCLMASLPTLVLATVATNQNPRLIAPSLLPLAIALGSLAALTGWTTSRGLTTTAMVVMTAQLVVMVSPTPGAARYQASDATADALLWGNPSDVMQRDEQRDWSQLRTLVQQQGVRAPAIAYLGSGEGLTAPELAAPWVLADEPLDLRWIWRYEEGDLDWDTAIAAVQASNVVVTALDITVNRANKDDLDNQHNAELIQRVAALPEFMGPFELKLGRFSPARILVFIKKPPTPLPPSNRPKLDVF